MPEPGQAGGSAGTAAPVPAAARLTDPALVPDSAAFAAEAWALWDGQRTLGGIWVALSDVEVARQVRLTNMETGAEADGALIRRDPGRPGPRLEISSGAAQALGLRPHVAVPVTVVALYFPGADGAVAEAGDPAHAPPGVMEAWTVLAAETPEHPAEDLATEPSPTETETVAAADSGEEEPTEPSAAAAETAPAGAWAASDQAVAVAATELPRSPVASEPAVSEPAASEPAAGAAAAAEGEIAKADQTEPGQIKSAQAEAGPTETVVAGTSSSEPAPPAPSADSPADASPSRAAATTAQPVALAWPQKVTGLIFAAAPARRADQAPPPSTRAADRASMAPVRGTDQTPPAPIPRAERTPPAPQPAAPQTAAPQPTAPQPAKLPPADLPGAPEPSSGTAAIADGRPFIQSGVFSDPDNASRLIARLRAAGLPAEGRTMTQGGQSYTRVVIGPYSSEAARDKALETARRIGPADAVPVGG